ncbi:MAG: L-fucose:H+ symporter permease [Akkermansiaceae bacterium]|nr:L-fucose:H+ symporter permease [Akkermansiaceae bacterium]
MFVAMVFILSNLTSVIHDPELAPVVSAEAHKLISEVSQTSDKSKISISNKKLNPDSMSLDAVKWTKIQELGLGSWVGGKAKAGIEKSLEEKTAVNWTETLALIQADHQRLGKVLAITSDTQTTDAEKWTLIQKQSLDTSLTDKQRKNISTKISKNKEVNWEQSPVLDGSPDEEQARTLISKTDPSQWTSIQKADLDVLQGPYFAIGIVVAIFFFIFLFKKLPEAQGEDDKSLHLGATLGRLFKNSNYVGGVIAQAFYVGAQIMIWTFIIQYAGNELGMRASTAQGYNIVAMIIFVSSRFICTFLLKYVSPGGLLSALAVGGGALVLGLIFIKGMPGLYCLIGVSACMSLMFPTIYGIALDGLGDDAKLGAAGLIMAIGGGCLMPPLQASIMDKDAFEFGSMTLSSTRVSFVLPLICFVAIAIYGFLAHRKHIGEAKA